MTPRELEIVTPCPLCADTGEGPNELVGAYDPGGTDDRGCPYSPVLIEVVGCRHADAYMAFPSPLSNTELRTIQAALDGALDERDAAIYDREVSGRPDQAGEPPEEEVPF